MCEGSFHEAVDDATTVLVRAFACSVETETKVSRFDEDFGVKTRSCSADKDVEKRQFLVFFYFMSEVQRGVLFEDLDQLQDVSFCLGVYKDVVDVSSVDGWLESGVK